jgi:hypothetical protein
MQWYDNPEKPSLLLLLCDRPRKESLTDVDVDVNVNVDVNAEKAMWH